MNTINDRIGEIMICYKLNQKEIALKLGTSQAYLSAIITGKRGVGASFLKRIYNHFPEIKKYWLLTGEGCMLNTELSDVNKPMTVNDEDAAEYGKGIFDNVLLKNKVKENKPPTSYYLPEVYASAGLDKGIINDELKRVPVNIPWLETGLTFINVYGDSMYPKYNAGEVIGVKPIEFKYLNYGYPYVIVFSNGDVFIKIVQPGADKDHLMLESVNEFYKPKEFHLEQMKSFYSIKGVIKKEMM